MKLKCGMVIQIFKWINWKKFLKTPDDNDFGYFIEVDLKNPDNIRNKKTKHFPFCPENKRINPDENNDYMKKKL